MCGILGSVNFVLNKETLDLLAHRGPDAEMLKKFLIDEHEVFFGHRRLSIVDLSPTGNQPMSSSCGRYDIIFNGEIYNHTDLRDRLGSVNFRGTSDTETIINYISKFGIEKVVDFNGIFALSVLDKAKKLLYLARDPFGVKPLYVYKTEGIFLFSSEVKPIIKNIPQKLVDREALTETLKLRFAPAPNTLFKGIEKVVPGTILKIDLTSNKLQYSTTKFSREIPKTIKITADDALIAYEKHFENAVKRQLMSDVEVGILLSGGVDSALVAYYAQKHSNKKLKAFTIGFKGTSHANEIEDAKITAKFLNLEHYYKEIDFMGFLEIIKKSVKIVEEPLGTTSTIPMLYLSELAKKHVKVVLTGQGADEPLGGYRRYQLELIRNKLPNFTHNLISNVFSNSKNETLRRGARTIKHINLEERLLSGYTLFYDFQIKKLTGETDNISKNHIKTTIDSLKFPQRKSDLEKQLGLDLRFNLSDDLLLYTDKITMNSSIEARVPILDLELIEFIESLPINHKVRFKHGKIIHKKLAEKVLPSSIVHRKKKGFLSPTNEWFRNHNEEISNILCDSSHVFSNYFDIVEVKKILEMHKNGVNYEKQIFLLLNVYYWLENFLE